MKKSLLMIMVWSTGAAGCKATADESPATPPARVPEADAPLSQKPPHPGTSAAAAIDLLRRATRLVLVSSHRDEISLGEFAVDGRDDTAWRPNPPDPKPWIEVSFSHALNVSAIELAWEADSKKPSAAPKRVTVELDGSSAGELIREASGVYKVPWQAPRLAQKLRLSIEKVSPKDQLSISTVAVRGLASEELLFDAKLPEVRVQGFPAFPPSPAKNKAAWLKLLPFLSKEGFCDFYREFLRSDSSNDARKIRCVVGDPIAVSGIPPPTVSSLRWVKFGFDDDYEGYSESALAIETASGWHLTSLSPGSGRIVEGCPGMPTGGDTEVLLRWKEQQLLAEQVRWFHPGNTGYYQGESRPQAAVRVLRVCSLESHLLCREIVTAFGVPTISGEVHDPISDAPKRWEWEREFEINSRGLVRFSPCHTPGSEASSRVVEVPCLAPGYSTLL